MTYAGNQHIAYQFDYDANNRVTVVTDSSARTLRYQYDLSGRRTSMTTPEGGIITYRYTANNQMTDVSTIEGNKTNISAYRYDALNRRTQRELPNGIKTTYRYDTNSRLMEIEEKDPRNRIFEEIKYVHDNVGNRIKKTIDHETIRCDYDAIYRLTQAESVGRTRKSLHGHIDEAYAYDPVGNRMTGPKTHDVYSHNAGNELLTDRRHQYEYDPNGNLIRKTRTDHHKEQNRIMEFAYDDENRLVKVTIRKNHKTREIAYAYDPFGRRISKTVSRDEIGDDEENSGRIDIDRDMCDRDHPRTTTYLYDGGSIILEYNQRNEVTRRYLHGPNIDEPLSVTEVKRHKRHSAHETYYYHAEGLGSITGLTDDRGHVVQRYEYDSFGNICQHGNRIRQPYTFTGREYDHETGLYFYRGRYYDPEIGRFINRDPIGFVGGDANLYAYVGNNPVNMIDPWGLYGWDIHYYKTYVWARMEGIDHSTAVKLAEANQMQDESVLTSAVSPLAWAAGGGLPVMHYVTRGNAELDLMKSIRLGMVEQFGRDLHRLQDSFSHMNINPAQHVEQGTTPDAYCVTSPRDQQMEEATRRWLKELAKSLNKRPFR
jgi:RHS repeat-associated protein